jgi:hypothetical protein
MIRQARCTRDTVFVLRVERWQLVKGPSTAAVKEKTLAPLHKFNENARTLMGQEIRGWKVYVIVRMQAERKVEANAS